MTYTTKKTLLESIKAGDEISWNLFYTTYTPLIRFCGKKSGIPEMQMEDLVQMVMLRFFKAQEKFTYDPCKGRFRSYLGRVIHSAINDLTASPEITGAIPEKSQVDAWSEQGFEEEWRQHVFQQASVILRQRVSADTYLAFEMYAINGTDPQEVAEFLKIKLQNVYEAKSRCLQLMREIVHSLDE